jgi:HPt (histidine-containing phosphotransfer) domain-containing protein
MVRFAISDTGPGVSPEAAGRLFKPFSPGDNSYARKEQGAGLGLAVTKRIVEQAGGQIGFESSPGDGALFWFTLPVSGQAGMATTPGQSAENAGVAPQGLSLLISVSAPNIAAALSNMLEPFGNRIVIAASAADAAARASKEHFDALLAGPSEADLLSAAPGVKAPIVAILLRGDRTPSVTDCVLRWPVTGHALFNALDSVCVPRERDGTSAHPAAIDAVTFSTLEKSVGVKTLIEILQCYEATAEQLTNALASACAEEKWDEAARLAQDIVGAAGGLGLTAMTQAARHFAKANREGENPHALRNAAQMVVGEHLRARKALSNLYPDLR